MSYIKFFKDINKSSVAIAGGKGASLGEMTGAKIPVPPGFVILSGAFDRYLDETGLNQEIKARLAEVDTKDTNSVDKASNVIRDTIHDQKFPADLKKEILAAYDELVAPTPSGSPSGRGSSNIMVAVRSSATAEDSAVASWAGELDTFLNTNRDNLIERVCQCWSSLFTPRAIFYRHEKNLIDHYVSVAVVVQQMVQSEISGIAFTVHPVTEDPRQMIIEAGLGLGEAIVSGQVTPDSYVLDKTDFSIIDINVGEQTRMLVKSKVKRQKAKVVNGDDDKSNVWVELGGEGAKQKLNTKQIVALAKICKKIEDHYGFPCDIEWAFAKGKFYITQSRPITTLKMK